MKVSCDLCLSLVQFWVQFCVQLQHWGYQEYFGLLSHCARAFSHITTATLTLIHMPETSQSHPTTPPSCSPSTALIPPLSSKSLRLSLSVSPCLSLLRELENWLQKATAVNKGQPHSWARPLYLSRHGGGGGGGGGEKERRRMEKNSFDQSLKPITRRKLLTRGLSLSVSFSPGLCSLCIFLSTPPFYFPFFFPPALSLYSFLFPPFLITFCAYFCPSASLLFSLFCTVCS